MQHGKIKKIIFYYAIYIIDTTVAVIKMDLLTKMITEEKFLDIYF